jgi:hypothetical protein
MSTTYKRTTMKKHVKPELDAQGHITLGSLHKGQFKRILRLYMLYVLECVRTLEYTHDDFATYYRKNVLYEFPRSKAAMLYLNERKKP